MADMKIMNSRVQLKCDTSTNWGTNNPVLKKGELGYASDKKYIKFGDGTTNWNSLDEIHVDLSKVDGVYYTEGSTYAQANPIALKKYVDDAIKDVTGAMHFIGVVDKSGAPEVTTGSTYTYDLLFNTLPSKGKNPVQGDVIIQATKEFVWASSQWKEFGKEGIYALQSDLEALATELSTNYVRKNGTDRLMTAAEGTKLSGIETSAQVNKVETISLNGQSFTIAADKSASLTIDVIDCGNSQITA